MPYRSAVLFLLLVAAAARADDPKPAALTFDADVQPVLKKHCGSCHNPDRPRGDLDLSTFAALSAGGVSGKAAVPGKPDDSPVYTLAAHLDEPKMPPNKPKLPQRELDLIRNWIAGGMVEKAAGKAVAAQAPPASAGGLVRPTPAARPTPVTAVAVSPTAAVGVASGTRQVLVYDLAAGTLLGAVPFPEGEVHVLRFSRDGSVLLAGGGVGGQSGKVVGFDPKTWKRLWEVGDETDAVLAADLSPDKSRVVLGGPGRAVKVFAVADGKQLHALRKPTDWVLSAGFSPDGLLVAAGDRFGGLYVWEAKSGKEFLTLRGHTKGVTGLGWRADGNVLASASDDGTVRLWDLHTGDETAKWTAHPAGVLSLDYHPSGVIAAGGRDGRVTLWTEKGEPVSSAAVSADPVQRVGLTADGKGVFAGGWAGAVWSIPAGGPAKELPLPVAVRPTAMAAVPVPVPPMRVAAVVPPVGPAVGSIQQELAETRKALAAATAALKAAEERLNKLEAELTRSAPAGGKP